MYSVYILKSKKNADLYVGSTGDVSKRVQLHNTGKVRSTKAYRPWELVEYRPCASRSEAMQLELFLKTGQQKEMLKRKYS